MSIIQTQLEVLNVNVDLVAVGFDDDGTNEMALGSDEVLGLVVGSISTPSTPTPFESIATPSTSNPKAKTTWELLKAQLSLNQKAWILHNMTSLLWHFFVVDVGSKFNLTFFQTMCCSICHFVSQAYSYGNTTKKRMGLFTYYQ
jgi:hypothetical protein